MDIRALALLLFLARVVPAQQPTPILPDPNLTPGSTFDVTAGDLCVPGYTKKVRNVPAEMKREVYPETASSLDAGFPILSAFGVDPNLIRTQRRLRRAGR